MVARTEPVDPPLTELVDLLRRYKRGEGIEQTPFPSFGQTSQRPIGEARFASASGEQMVLPGAAPAGAHSGQADIVDWLVPASQEADLRLRTFRGSCLVQ